MRTNNSKSVLRKTGLASALLLTSGLAIGQVQVSLTAGPANAGLPDGSNVPMWGYTCGPVTGTGASCAKLNPAATGWSPVVITVPTGQPLEVDLKNNLPVPPQATAGIPTSLVIVGQLGGGLGTRTASCDSTSCATVGATCTPSPDHSSTQANVTWPIAGPAGAPGTPPPQGPRVQSFS